MKFHLTRRRFLKIAAGSVAGAGIASALYGYFLEPYRVAVEQHILRFAPGKNPPSGLRMVHLSDLHRSEVVPDSYLLECFSKANQLNPDLVVMTGDYITSGSKWSDSLGDLLASLQASLGIYATLGNHDGGQWAGFDTLPVREELEKAGIRVLTNESVALEHTGKPFTVVGLGDLWAGDFDPSKSFEGVKADRFTIALSHNPDTITALQEFNANIILCGHTHGGQVRIPLLGPLVLPVKDKRFSAGIYRVGEQIAYVNRGIGLLRRIRFNCRPEIACIDIA